MQSEAKANALGQFTDYFVKNYPGPDTIIYDPKWHAPKIFAAAYSAITAALSEQERAVEVKALEWREDRTAKALGATWMVWHYSDPLKDGLGQWLWQVVDAAPHASGRFHTEAEAKDAAQADYEQRIRSALVDVPVEPVAWLPADEAPRGVYALIKHRSGQLDLCYKTDNGEPFLETWRYAGTANRGEQAPWPESYIPVSALRTSPPLSRQGEDRAEVDWLTRPVVGIENRTAQEVFDIMADRIRLAAARSGSATTTSGTGEA